MSPVRAASGLSTEAKEHELASSSLASLLAGIFPLPVSESRLQDCKGRDLYHSLDSLDRVVPVRLVVP